MTDATGEAALRELLQLLPLGADFYGLDDECRSALWHAAWRGKLGLVIHLVSSAPKLLEWVTLPDSYGRSPLYAAAGYPGGGGHLAVVQWLAGHGGSVTQPNNKGTTPL